MVRLRKETEHSIFLVPKHGSYYNTKERLVRIKQNSEHGVSQNAY